MSKLTDFKVLCFDVYGTLIDWETGITTALAPLFAASSRPGPPRAELLSALHTLETAQQRLTPTLPYRDLPPPPSLSSAFGASVGSWPAFPDTVAALRRLSSSGYKLVVLSNTDRASFAATNAGPLEGVPFDLVLTAEDVGSFKPAARNFDIMLKEVGDKLGVGREGVLQTAQSQFHDHHPARAKGVRSCWIARQGAVMGNMDEEVYDWKFVTLGEMADAVEAERAVVS
ncbi:HAD-like domain protein [Cordyceps fumosorosea ARSEF 2679]|uniref:HAD-like domain protein n=1 Tax=Cordyceps fumosorosea (strain ARSEF 2679) TaxID=1081104 RepID=A0A167N4V1_CORFA|nr:HAD-like domain protein [Cordyceps fumosorosea ARSEF 2679]OAA55128.1 HAD-like domain protein [Cordyceps fumosorosea ARSEF 2679]